MKKIKLKKHQEININFPLNYNNVEELFISKLKLKKNKNLILKIFSQISPNFYLFWLKLGRLLRQGQVLIYSSVKV